MRHTVSVEMLQPKDYLSGVEASLLLGAAGRPVLPQVQQQLPTVDGVHYQVDTTQRLEGEMQPSDERAADAPQRVVSAQLAQRVVLVQQPPPLDALQCEHRAVILLLHTHHLAVRPVADGADYIEVREPQLGELLDVGRLRRTAPPDVV